MAAGERRSTYSLESDRSRSRAATSSPVAFLDHLSESSLEVRKGRGERRAAGINDDVPLWIELGPVQAECLPHAPLDTVSDHASTDRARDGETQSRSRAFVIMPIILPIVFPCQAKGGEQGAGNSRAVVIHFSKVGGAQSPIHGRTNGRATTGQISWRSGQPSRRSRSVCGGRGPDGATTRPARSWSSCAREIRAPWRACDC